MHFRLISIIVIIFLFSCERGKTDYSNDKLNNSKNINPFETEILSNNGKPTKKGEIYYESLNTELDQLMVGNFDFYFDGKSVYVIVRVKFAFEEKILINDRNKFKTKFFNGINSYWTTANVSFEAINKNAKLQNIPLHIICYESDLKFHKMIHVMKKCKRANVFAGINLAYDDSEKTFAHEFGHLLGLYDNYDGGTFENSMPWHDNRYLKDSSALMNSGTELRKRYFEHFLKELNSIKKLESRYSINSSFE